MPDIAVYMAECGPWRMAIAAASPEQALACARLQGDLPYRNRESLAVERVRDGHRFDLVGRDVPARDVAARASRMIEAGVQKGPMVVWRHDWVTR